MKKIIAIVSLLFSINAFTQQTFHNAVRIEFEKVVYVRQQYKELSPEWYETFKNQMPEQAVNYYVVAPELERAMRQSGAAQPPGMALFNGWVGVAINLVVRLWYPALIFYYYNRRHVKDAFLRGLPGKGI